ncbi:hypothetical protein J6590_054950 [Homalodisca vitripennis]|nr:hypothetical protein J6590_054950 [Homalodisca vitripennis]
MSTIDWLLLLSGQDATSSWNLFFEAILNLMEIYFPCKLQRCGKKWPKKRNTGSWYSPELHELKNHVMTLHTIANCTKSPVDKQAYITARNKYKSAIRDAKKSTNEHFIDTSGNKTKAAWQVVKSLTGSSSSQSVISPSLEEFTTFYGGMVEELRQKIPSAATSADVLLKKILRPNVCFRWKSVTTDEVLGILIRLKPSKSKDIYFMSNDFIKSVADQLSDTGSKVNGVVTGGQAAVC